MSRAHETPQSRTEPNPERTIKRRAIPITIAFMILFALGALFHYLFVADDVQDQVVGPTPEEALVEQ